MTDYKAIKYDFSGADLTGIVLPPTISEISPTSSTEDNLPIAITITGTGFIADSTVKFIGASGTSVSAPSVTFNSATELVATAPTGVGGVNEDPWDVLVENPVQGQGDNLFTIDDNPIFTTAAGTLGTIIDSARTAPAYTLSTAAATDPEGASITYSLISPGPAVSPGLAFDTTNAAITGNADAVGGDTTTTFTVRATAGAQTADRIFSIVVAAPVQTYFTTAGAATEAIAFTANIKVLVVGGGGSGDGQGHDGGGGGGGLIVHPSYAATPQTYGYYIGSGGPNGSSGENSNWGVNTEPASTTSTILTGLGGGKGNASDGGSGGGKAHSAGSGGATLQANSPLISADAKTYGFGNAGGAAPYSNPAHPSGGGGGAGAAGQDGQGGSTGGAGGSGKDVSTDFGSAQGSPGGHFSGGGGGGCHNGGTGGNGANGGGNGAGTGNSGPGNAATAITGSGGGAGAAGGNGVIAIAY